VERDCHAECKNTVFYTADIFKVFCTFASCFKTGSKGRLLKYAAESGHMFDRCQLGGSSIWRHIDPGSDSYFGSRLK